MENLVIDHKDQYKKAIGYFAVAAVLAAMAITVRDQWVLSAGTWIAIAAFFLELGFAIYTFLKAGSTETFTPEGITVADLLHSKTFSWGDLTRFEILWDYEGKRMVKKEEVDAPYILLEFANPKKKLRFEYNEAIDLCIRCNYGEPHRDDWTHVGK